MSDFQTTPVNVVNNGGELSVIMEFEKTPSEDSLDEAKARCARAEAAAMLGMLDRLGSNRW